MTSRVSRPFNGWDALKLAALLLMFIDHAGHFYWVDANYLRAIGRGAAVIFLFLTGLAGHYRFDRKLLYLAILLTISDWAVTGHPNTLNILWTILLARMALNFMESRQINKLKIHEWIIGAIALIFSMALFQYGTIGLLIALSGYVYKHHALYSLRTPQIFLDICLVIYSVIMIFLFKFSVLASIIMIVTLWGVRFCLQHHLTHLSNPVYLPNNIVRPAILMARHSGLIYVVHLIALGWATGKSI